MGRDQLGEQEYAPVSPCDCSSLRLRQVPLQGMSMNQVILESHTNSWAGPPRAGAWMAQRGLCVAGGIGLGEAALFLLKWESPLPIIGQEVIRATGTPL